MSGTSSSASLASSPRPLCVKSTRKPAARYSIIPTALINISSDAKNWYQARAILDTGSETNLITLACAKLVGLRISSINSQITGVGGNCYTKVLGCTCCLVQQKYGYPHLLIPLFVVEQVTLDLPSARLPRVQWSHLEELDLADPHFHHPSPVDIIFSGDVFNSIVLSKTVPSLRGSPIAISSTFGWLVSGGYSHSYVSKRVQFNDVVEVHEFAKPNDINDSAATCAYTLHADQYAPRPQRKNWYGLRTSNPSNPASITPLWSTQTATAPSTIALAPISTNHPTARPASDQVCAELLERMFKIESVEDCSPWTPEEIRAEELFRKSVTRLADGRFQVSLPFKTDPSKQLGHSKSIALNKFKSLERRLSKSPQNRSAYNKFMQDYIDQKHMELAPPLSIGQPHYYIPHHSVHRPDDPPDKIRVVFNASQPTTSKLSLNDLLLPGPKLQLDISEVITRFRQDRWVFIADIRQMFRQMVHPASDRDFLRILWRFQEDEPLKEYRLCTVTYGTASAPFLSNRVIRELADLHSQSHPHAANILKFRTYVDDLNGGSDDIKLAVEIRKELQFVLATAQLELRKWAANDHRLLTGIPKDHLLPNMASVQLEEDTGSTMKVLGLSWQPMSDSFHYVLRPMERIQTKRQLASQIARVYDPLGWLMPLTVYARIIFRNVVQNHHDWDDLLPTSVTMDWMALAQELPDLALLHIPRYIPVASAVQWIVGFSDASEKAYGAVVYLLSVSNDAVTVSLITSRARMAPVKAMTLPRLELCGAQLLAKTIHKIVPSLRNIQSNKILAFSDSQIVLSWLTAKQAPVWKVFVGNRVANVLEMIPSNHWFHVSSRDNPADHASRGLRPRELLNCKHWWQGPEWLLKPFEFWPVRQIQPNMNNPMVMAEARTLHVTIGTISPLTHGCTSIEERFSSVTTLQNVVAYCLRYINLLRVRRSPQQRMDLHAHLAKVQKELGSANHVKTVLGRPLSTDERSNAMNILVRRAQAQALAKEIADVQSKRPKLRISRFLGLFIDIQGILRVGGRLRNSQLPDSQKHPALLPSHHTLTRLLIDRSHRSLFHAGPLSTLHHLRYNFWIVNGKNVVRRQLAQCVKCCTIRPKPFQPEIGQLPLSRTHLDSPFTTTGIDYAGPFPVSIAGLRGNKILNCYLSIFVCFAVKAVHIEVVTDLSTAGFLQAYYRFVARRGHPHTIWSDNGRNFLGAANELRRVQALLRSSDHQTSMVRESSNQGTTWKFIPPSAPFFGGLWEAAVKQTKRLLRNCLRDQLPTLETFTTIVTQIEAVLNSRPLTAMSSSPDDLAVLTPAHFLIFRPLTMPACEPDIEPRTLKDRHRFTQFIIRNFWHRWKKEYLLELQCRVKWDRSGGRPARVDDLVMIINENTPPMAWPLGKIIKLYPGTDGITRVADVRTPSGTISRPVRKLCPLPDEVCGTIAPTAGEDVDSRQLPSSQLMSAAPKP